NRHRWAASASAVATVLAAVVAFQTLDRPRTLTQADVDAAVEYTLKHRPTPPSTSSVAAEIIRPSVVRVVGYLAEEATPDPKCAAVDAKSAPGEAKPGSPAAKPSPAAAKPAAPAANCPPAPPPQGARPGSDER